MKRIKAACLEQTIHFMLREGYLGEMAKREVKQEVEKYKNQLDRNKTKYKIIDESEQEDGSVILKIKKQYNGHAIGEYFD